MNLLTSSFSSLIKNFCIQSADEKYNELISSFSEIIYSKNSFKEKIHSLNSLAEQSSSVNVLQDVLFDFLILNEIISAGENARDDYFDTLEWQKIEEETLDKGTEMLNLFLYLQECNDEKIEPTLDDFINEFLLADEEEFGEEQEIYKPVILAAELQLSIENFITIYNDIEENSPVKDIFLPMMCLFNSEITENDFISNCKKYVPDFALIIAYYFSLKKFLILR